MSRVPSSHLSHLGRRSTSPPPPPPPPTPQPLIFSSRNPSSIDLPPQSWLEMGISGHSLTFSFHLDNQEIIMDLQDPAYVAQIITEGMRLGIEACINHMNIPGTELPFYHPEQPGGAILAPLIQSQLNPPVSLFQIQTSDCSNIDTHDSIPQIEQDTTCLPSMALQQGIRPKMYVLDSVKSFIIEEEYIKKYILKCPVRLEKCTMDIRVIKNPNSKKESAVLLVPTLVNLPVDEDEEDEEPPKMSLIIWNCRGSENSDFRISFRSMLDYYRPTMVLLLETQMIHHHHLADDFSFSDIANVPAIEGCGGMVLVWKKEFVAVDGLLINNEEIHCTINVI